MRTKFSGILTLFLAFVVQISFAQEKTVTGTVTDPDGLPLPGVNIVIEDTSTGTQTDFDGNYSIQVSEGETLVFSYVGFVKQEIKVGNSNSYNVSMSSDNTLDEVVVQAYRTSSEKKSNIASSTVTSSTIENRPNANVIQTLQGQVAGLNIQTGSGQPGANSTVILRGAGSINGSVEPLYIIDGVPQDGDNFRSINPNEIESVSVLKDAGATAIYGNRGANGVIIVKTKSAAYGSKLDITYLGSSGFTALQSNDYDLMDSKTLLSLEKRVGTGYGATLSDEEISNYSINTDWKDYFFRTGLSQSHTVNLSSGSENLTSFTSLGYFNQEGILENTDLNRFTFRNNLNGKSEDGKFNYSTNLSINWSKRNEATSLGTGSINQNYVIGASSSVPYISPGMYNGSRDLFNLFNSGDQSLLFPAEAQLLYTPLTLIDKLKKFRNQYDELKSIANLNASYKITDHITASTSLGLDFTQNVRSFYEDPDSFNSYAFLGSDQEFGGRDANSMSRQLIINSNTNISYRNTFDEKHSLEVSLFTEYVKAHLRGFGFTQNGLNPKNSAPYSGSGYIGYDGTPYYVPDVNANKVDAGLFSYFGFADYDYMSKYGFSATLRRDASYRFSNTNRWGTFWSLSGRWNISEENFMDNSIFNMLKLRGSYGVTGNQNILGESLFNATNLSRQLYTSLTGYAANPALGVSQIANQDLRWEEVTQANIGIDFEVFDRSLRGSVDVYQKVTDGLYQGVQLSAINAITSINANNGEMRNRGVEFNLNYDLIRQKDLKITLKANGAYNKNEIIDMPSENGNSWNGTDNTINAEGHPLNTIYVLDYVGVNPANGNLLYKDAEGNLTENPDPTNDRYYTDKNYYPNFQGGFGFDIDYKGFYLSSLFTYAYDVWRFDYDYSGLIDPTGLGRFNMSNDLLRAWTPENTQTDIPALSVSDPFVSDSDRFVKDASYIRMRYITLGYNFQPKILDKTFFNQARIYVQAENLVTWTKWRGWDAESNRVNDQYQYPTPRIYSIGVELKF